MCCTFLGDVTLGDVQLVLPFSNTMDVLDLQGKYLREALEISVSEYNPDDPHGRFLQMSGKFLRLIFYLFFLFKP